MSTHPETSPAAEAPPRSKHDILAGLPALAEAIAEGAPQREAQRELPFEAFRLVRRSGLGLLRVPLAHGGPGATLDEVIEAVVTLAAADSNVAHALRSHFNTTELLLLAPETPATARQRARVLEGRLFGGAFTELGTARAGQSTTTLTRRGDHHVLNGRKYYATGTAYADYASVFAQDEDGRPVTAVIPVDREGVRILDDWDGMGQRLTASGSLALDHVVVHPDELGEDGRDALAGRHASALRQLFLVATANGIVRNVLADAVHYVRHHGRPAMHSPATSAREDHVVQAVVGDLSAATHAVDELVAANARALERSSQALLARDPQAEALVLQGALVTAKTQLVVSRLALDAAERLFEAGGASTTSRRFNFDRHWRNLRTIFSHNPLGHKVRILGDYHLNGTTTHLEEGRVF